MPVGLGAEALRERALTLLESGFRWDDSTAPRLQTAVRDEIGSNNPTDQTIVLQGWSDAEGIALLENEPDVVTVWKVENEWWDKLVVDNRKS